MRLRGRVHPIFSWHLRHLRRGIRGAGVPPLPPWTRRLRRPGLPTLARLPNEPRVGLLPVVYSDGRDMRNAWRAVRLSRESDGVRVHRVHDRFLGDPADMRRVFSRRGVQLRQWGVPRRDGGGRGFGNFDDAGGYRQASCFDQSGAGANRGRFLGLHRVSGCRRHICCKLLRAGRGL
jgi:hypothetical protein